MSIYRAMILAKANELMLTDLPLCFADRVIDIANESGEWDLKEMYELVITDPEAAYHFERICESVLEQMFIKTMMAKTTLKVLGLRLAQR